MSYIGKQPASAALATTDLADNIVTEAKMADDAISIVELKAGTDGNIISYDASGNPVAIATGSDGQVLTSAGAGAQPAFEAAGGGAWNFIATQTASTSSLIEFDTDEITSTYDVYKIFITNLHVSDDNVQLYVQFSQGSSYVTSGYRFANGQALDNGATTGVGETSEAFIRITRDFLGNATGETSNWECTLPHPLGTDNGKLIYYSAVSINHDPKVKKELGAGAYLGNQTALDAIKFYASAGTLASGTFAIYGLAKS